MTARLPVSDSNRGRRRALSASLRAAAMVVATMMLRLAVATAQVAQLAHAQDGTGFFLADAAAKDGAVCLDGTPGAYYLSPGSGSGASSW